jgi:hypothetical protein
VDAAGDGRAGRRGRGRRRTCGHDGEQDLGGADVAGGLVAADVLFAGLQAEAAGGLAVAVDADADEAAGHAAFEFVADRHEAGVRAAEAERHAEALGAADADVGAEFAGWHEQGEGEQVGGDDHLGAGGVGRRDDRP